MSSRWVLNRLLKTPKRQGTTKIPTRFLSSSTSPSDDCADDLMPSPQVTAAMAASSALKEVPEKYRHHRIWRSDQSDSDGSGKPPLFWSDDVISSKNAQPQEVASLLHRIERQELSGARMRTKQLGVLHEDPVIDMRLLADNYTVPSLASALRDREEILQYCATLARDQKWEELGEALYTFHPELVSERRQQRRRVDVRKRLTASSLETIRKALMRMPRRVTSAHSKRAGVVIPICHVDGVPSILLEKRATNLRAHPDEVCLPGGMVCSVADRTIVETCLREMQEEIGGLSPPSSNGDHPNINVLGVLRCNWGEVHHLVGVAVTPVVCVLGQDLASADLKPNPDEVAEVFTIPLASLLDKSQWIYKDDHAPIFVGGPYVIWGLTGYILERFWKDILVPSETQQ